MEIQGTTLLQRRDITLIDIRDPHERLTVGYIPGSLLLPLEPGADFLHGLAALPRQPIALVCMSGRRSAATLSLAQEQGFSEVYSLAGGVLGWGAVGLPLCGVREVAPSLVTDSLEAIERELISCFVAESIETMLSLEGDLSANPHQDVRAVLTAAHQRTPQPTQALREAIAILGHVAWQRGHDPAKIAENVDMMAATIAAFEAGRPAGA